MSCFILRAERISSIALAASMGGGRVDFEEAPWMYQALAEANLRAFQERYRERAEDDDQALLAGFDRTAPVPSARNAVELLKLIDCFEYQACDWSGFSGSTAAKLCRSAREKVIRLLPGYDEAPWG